MFTRQDYLKNKTVISIYWNMYVYIRNRIVLNEIQISLSYSLRDVLHALEI